MDKNTKYIKCRKCNIIVLEELKINHCSNCEVCIIKHDHHCIWTGKCIGKNNIYFFFIFIFSLFLFILISFLNIFIYLIQKFKRDKDDKMLELLF
jgi:palmitoyltransferase ZDHHC9/14/18